jgi:tetratricopeptide (TPR) repeat protein
VFFLCQFVFAQTSSRVAQEWFDTGRKEKDLSKKIEAFQKAVEADPKFVQALYYLGLTHKRQRDFVRAELFLNQAKDASSSLRKKEDRFAIYYELSKLHVRVGNAATAEELLRESLRLNVGDELAGKGYFELGRLLFNQGRYAEALDVLKAGQQLKSENIDFFNNLIALSENSIRQEQLYSQADLHVKSGNVREAKALFEQVKLENPDFKDVQIRIVEVDSLIKVQRTLSTFKDLYTQAENYEKESNFAMAIANYESILQKSRNYKDTAARLANARQKLQAQQFATILNKNYQEGVNAAQKQDWPRAITALERVVEMDASFLDARTKLAEARRQVEPDTLKNVIFRYYKFGLEAMENDDFEEALRAFKRVEKLNANYRNVTSLISVLEQAMLTTSDKNIEVATQTLPSFSEEELDSLYTEALILMDDKDWIRAIVFLEKLRLIKTDYRDVENLLVEARVNLTKNDALQISQPAVSGDSNILLIGSGLIALVFLPLIGIVVFSPMARARLYLLRGNYTAASLIYENALMKNPGKLKLYSKLAHIYLLSGRNDENAIKVFKTVLKLNLQTDERNEMNSIVRNYLKAGKTEDDAISVLERALRAEQENQVSQRQG